MRNYNGQLNQNLITAALRNMVISQTVFDIKTATPRLADVFRVDGTLYGDTKLFYSADIGTPQEWASDENSLSPDRLAPNLLQINRNKSAVCQSIRMGEYFYTSITTDMYLSKQAFMAEGSFSEMLGVLKGSLTQIKKVYDNALINSAVGTHVSTAKKANITVEESDATDPEAKARLTAQAIMKELMVLKADLEDNTRDFNELGYLRSNNPEDLIAIWNVNQKAKITKMDLPSLFHKEGLDSTGLTEYYIPERWFGKINTITTTASADVRCAKSGWYDVSATGFATKVEDYAMLSDADKAKCIFMFAGDNMPSGAYVDNARGITVTVKSTSFPANCSYTVDPKALFILVDKQALPYMSGFETATEFVNQLSLTNNNYLIWGHNKLEFLADKPFIRVSLS